MKLYYVLPSRRTGWRTTARNCAILFLLLICMYWKLVLTRQYTWLNNREAAGLLLPWFELEAAQLHRLALTLWDPYQWCGQPLIGQGQAGTAYPLNWLLWVLPTSHGWLRHAYLNWYLVLIHFQAAAFMYWLCRDLGRSSVASIFAGLLFSVGPLMGVSDWPSVLNAAVWAPLILMFFFRALGGQAARRAATYCGAALGCCWLSGSDGIPALLTLVALGLWCYLASVERRWELPLVVAGVALGISALQAFPTFEYLVHAPQSWWHFSASEWNDHAVPPLALPGVVSPQFYTEMMIFAGWTLLTFAAIGFWTEARIREVRILAGLALLGFLLSFGRYAAFEGVLYGLRILARDPKLALVLFGVGLSTLAAFGLDVCRTTAPGTAAFVRRTVLALAGVSGLCWVVLLLLTMTGGDDLKKFTPLALCALGAAMVAALLEGWRRAAISPMAASVCAILLAMWEFGNVAGSTWINVEYGWGWLSQLANAGDAVRFLRAQPEPVRVDVSGLLYNFGDWNGVEQFTGISGGTDNVVSASRYPSARALAGTNYAVGTKPLFSGQQQVLDSPGGVKVFRNPDAAPRAFVLHEAVAVRDGEVAEFLSKPVGDLRARAFVIGSTPPALESCSSADTASILWRRGRSIRVKASLMCRGLLVLGETWYPGWSASVDGKSTRLYEAYGFLQAAVVPAGTHDVTFTYRPYSVWLGAVVSFASVLGVAVLARKKPPR